ncbi:MAG: hypothetical protein P8X88_00090, partial [Gammaproteobacteria bacterium]
ADGFFAHPFSSRKSLLENTLPALERGLAASGRRREDLEIICATLVVTADEEDELERSRLAARKQLAFYGSTPAYLPTLACHGWEALHGELNRLWFIQSIGGATRFSDSTMGGKPRNS